MKDPDPRKVAHPDGSRGFPVPPPRGGEAAPDTRLPSEREIHPAVSSRYLKVVWHDGGRRRSRNIDLSKIASYGPDVTHGNIYYVRLKDGGTESFRGWTSATVEVRDE